MQLAGFASTKILGPGTGDGSLGDITPGDAEIALADDVFAFGAHVGRCHPPRAAAPFQCIDDALRCH
jgi:hypothetical protein